MGESQLQAERDAALALQQAVANHNAIARLVLDKTEEAGAHLDQVAANVQEAEENARQGVQELASATRADTAVWKNLVGPSIGLAVFGIVAVTPATLPVGIGCGVVSGGVGHLGARKV